MMRTLASLQSSTAELDLHAHITRGSCIFLASSMPKAKDHANATRYATSIVDDPTYLSSFADGKIKDRFRRQLAARRDLIQAFHGESLNIAKLKQAILNLVNVTMDTWDYVASEETIRLASSTVSHEPSFQSVIRESGNLARVADVLASIAYEIEGHWLHPGILMAGEMIAAMVGDNRIPEGTVTSNLILALDDPSEPFGIVVRLTVDRIAGGAGYLAPDPFYCGYLQLDNDFSTGLQNAWFAGKGFIREQAWNNRTLDYDWRWRLDLLGVGEQIANHASASLIQLPIVGRSTEVAIASTLIAAAKGNPDAVRKTAILDPHAILSAAFDTESKNWKDEQFSKLDVEGVGFIKTKSMPGNLRRERITRFVISTKQPKADIPYAPEVEFESVGNLAAGYQSLRLMPRISRDFNRSVISMLASHKMATASANGHARHSATLISIDSTEGFDRSDDSPTNLVSILRFDDYGIKTSQRIATPQTSNAGNSHWKSGQLATERGESIWVTAADRLDAGEFIVACQRNISSCDAGLLPIRFGNSLEGDPRMDSVTNWEDLANPTKLSNAPEVTKVLNHAYPETKSLNDDVRTAWIAWLIRNRRVVFLFDASDPATRELASFPRFLQQADIAACPVVVVVSDESKATQESALGSSRDWQQGVLSQSPAAEQRRKLAGQRRRTRVQRARSIVRTVPPLAWWISATLGVALLLIAHELYLRNHYGWLDFDLVFSNTLATICWVTLYLSPTFTIAAWLLDRRSLPRLSRRFVSSALGFGITSILFTGAINYCSYYYGQLASDLIATDEYRVLILEFDGTEATKKYSIASTVVSKLTEWDESLRKLGPVNGHLRFIRMNRLLGREDDKIAEGLARRYKAPTIVWGEYDDGAFFTRVRDFAEDHARSKTPDSYGQRYPSSIDVLVNSFLQTRDLKFYSPHDIGADVVGVFSLLHAKHGTPPSEIHLLRDGIAALEGHADPSLSKFIHSARFTLLISLSNSNRFDEAYELATELISQETDPELYLLRANVCIANQRFELALPDIEKAASLGVDQDEVTFTRGWLADETGDCDDAIKLYESLLNGPMSSKLTPIDKAYTLNNLAVVRRASDPNADLAKILAMYDEAIDIFPRHALALKNRAVCRMDVVKEIDLFDRATHTQNFVESIRDCEKSIEIEPYWIPAHVALMRAHIYEGNYPKAILASERVTKFSAEQPLILTLRGLSYRFQIQYARGTAEFQHAVKSIAKIDSTRELLREYGRLDDHDDMTEFFRRFGVTFFDDSLPHVLTGLFFAHSPYPSEADQYFQLALAVESDPATLKAIEKIRRKVVEQPEEEAADGPIPSQVSLTQ